MKKYERELKNPRQMIRVDGKDTFLEVIAPVPEFNKVTVNLVKYNKETHKQLCLISNYYEISEFLQLCHYMKFGKVKAELEAEKNRLATLPQGTYPNKIRMNQGGGMKDGVLIARNLSFQPATKSETMQVRICAERGYGVQTKEGLVYIDYKKAVDRIMVPCTYEDLDKIAVICEMRLQAYITARQLRGDFDDMVRERSTNDGTAPDTPQTGSTPQFARNEPIVDMIEDVAGFY